MKGFYNFQIFPDDNLVPIRPLPIAIRKINVNIAAMQLQVIPTVDVDAIIPCVCV